MKKSIALVIVFFSVLFISASCKKSGDEFIKIGLLYSFNRTAGESMKNAALLAVDEINKSGGIKYKKNGKVRKRKIELVYIDDAYTNVAKASFNLRSAIDENNLEYIIGGFLSKTVMPLMEIMAKKKVLWLCTGGASSRIIKKIEQNYQKYKYYFRSGVLDTSVQGKTVAAFAKIELLTRGIKKIAVIAIDHSYGKLVSKNISNLMKLVGFEIVSHTYITSDKKNFDDVIKNIKKAHGILCVFLSDEGTNFIKEAGKFGLNKSKPIFGIIAPSYAPGFYDKTNKGALWVTSHQSNGGPVDKTGNGLAMKFIREYKKRYKVNPFWLSQAVYDSFFAFKKAMETAKSKDVNELIKTFESPGFEYTGFMRLKWKKNNHDLYFGSKNGKMYAHGTVFQFFPDGKRYPVYPDKFKVRDYNLPRP